jgi:hypothetical protein
VQEVFEMKIKIFSTHKTDLEELENSVNSWLVENKIEVFEFQITSTSEAPDKYSEYVMVIRYG